MKSESICSLKIPDSHFDLPWKFTTLTASPIWNILSRQFYPPITWYHLFLWWLGSINSIAGDWPVVDCENIQYRTKTRNDRVSRSPGTFLSPLLMVCTARLANPFEERSFGAHLTSLMCYIIAEGFRFMPLSLARLRTFRLSSWVS